MLEENAIKNLILALVKKNVLENILFNTFK